MPRLNIDDSLYSDPRFMRLCTLLEGNYAAALGFCVIAWTLGQKWYRKSPTKLIPLAEWKNAHITEAFLTVGLAIKRDDGIEIVGADENFGWLELRAAAGQRGGEAKARNQREKSLANSSKSKQTVASSSSSSSEEKNKESPNPPAAPGANVLAGGLQDQLQGLVKEWDTTLKHYGRARDPRTDSPAMLQLLRAYGFERTRNALMGFRFEERSNGYDPRKHMNIGRLMKPESFKHLEALGESQADAKSTVVHSSMNLV